MLDVCQDKVRAAQDPEDFQLLLQSLRRFVVERLIPRENEVAETGAIPPDIVYQMRELGLFGISIPTAYSGLGLNMAEEVEIVLVLSETSPAFRSVVGTNIGIGSQALVLAGTKQQRSRYLPQLATGRLVGSFALTEPDAGSDAMAIRTSPGVTATATSLTAPNATSPMHRAWAFSL